MPFTQKCPNPSCGKELIMDNSDPSLYKMFPLHMSVAQTTLTWACGACNYAWPAVPEGSEYYEMAAQYANQWTEQNVVTF